MFQDADLKWFGAVVRMRPEQLGMIVKAAMGVPRRAVRTPTGHTFWIDPMTPFGLSLLRRTPCEPQMEALLAGALRPGDTYIDLGANEGFFAMLAASAVSNTGRVFAVEPQQTLRAVLLKNADLNNAGNVSVHSLAISDSNGSARLFTRSSINSTASRLTGAFRFGLGFRAEVVETRTLPAFCLEHGIDRARLLKIDCEGAEAQIVPGARELLVRHAFDFVALEYHLQICGAEACRRADEDMRSAGYKLAQWNGQTIYYLDAVQQDLAAISPQIRFDCAF